MLEIIIIADTNDADDITSINPITKEQIEKFTPLFEAIDKIGGKTYGTNNFARNHNWFTQEYQDTTVHDLYPTLVELAEEFNTLVPYGEYGVHTIKSITIKETKVLMRPLA